MLCRLHMPLETSLLDVPVCDTRCTITCKSQQRSPTALGEMQDHHSGTAEPVTRCG